MSPSRWAVGDPTTPVAFRVFANLYVSVFGRRRFYRMNQRLLNLAVRGMGIGNPSEDVVGDSEMRFLRKLSAVEALTVFDVGAHTGEYATHLREMCPQARILSFEPHPASFRRLKVAADRGGFEAIEMALSDAVGSAHLYDHALATTESGSAHATLHPQVIERIHHDDASEMDVRTTTVDEFMESRKIAKVNLLKIDAEGHELAILRGARRALNSEAIDLVQFEFNEMNVMSRVFFKDFYDVLPGFSFYRMVADGLAPMGEYRPRTHELFILQNVIALRDGAAYTRSLI